jgi:hypothetical protein
MSIEQLQDFEFFSSNFFLIRSKSGEVKPLILNRAQQYTNKRLNDQLSASGKVRALILKGRQQGASTLIAARYAHRVITTRGIKAYILTHEAEATANLFGMTKRYIDNLPLGLCPKPDSSAANKLHFKSFDSGYAVGTAGNKGAGRSQTVQLFHGSEVAFWPHAEEHAKGIMQAIPRDHGTEIILESTANGMGNYFHHMWQTALSGTSEYQAIFLPWYWQDEYSVSIPGFIATDEEQEIYDNFKSLGLTLDHLTWRRLKISEFNGHDLELGTEQFKQEYPMTAAEAFRNPVANAFINSICVMRARKTDVESDSGLIIGVDPALGDKDKFAIIRRRGRLAYKLERHTNHNTMQIAGLIRKIIEREQPVKVYIDCIGIGAGVVDRLLEMGFTQVEGINSARTASERDKYVNKRAEMWNEMREWLNGELPVKIPDSDVLHTDLCGLGYKYDSNGRLLIEKKDDLKKRGLDSPDTADALALTFAGGFYDISHGEAAGRDFSLATKGNFY